MRKILLIFALLFPLSAHAADTIGSMRGVVEFINERTCTEEEQVNKFLPLGQEVKCETVLVRLQDSKQQVSINHLIQSPLDPIVSVGSAVILYTQTDEQGNTTYAIQDYDHMSGIFWLTLSLIIFVLILGRRKGFRALLALFLSLLIIFAGLVPLLMRGYSPLLLTFCGGVLITVLSLLLINGFQRRTLSMILGTGFGLLASTLLAYIFGYIFGANGVGTEDVRNLALLRPELDYRGLLFAGIALGSLGAVMDVAVSITSALDELSKTTSRRNFRVFWDAGMALGQDILGSMMNTLVFAYVGSAYAMIFTFIVIGELSFSEIINLGFISEEILRSLVGSLGLLFTIPATVFLNASVLSKTPSPKA